MAKAKKSVSRKAPVKKNNEKKGLIIAVAAIALVALFGTAYAFFTTTDTGEATNTITAGSLILTLNDTAADGININGGLAIPLKEATALAKYAAEEDGYKVYTFEVENTGSASATYDLTFVDEGTNTMDKKNVRFKLSTKKAGEGDFTPAESALVSSLQNGGAYDGKFVKSQVLASGQKDQYKLYVWIDQTATNQGEDDITGQTFSVKVKVDGVQTIQ